MATLGNTTSRNLVLMKRVSHTGSKKPRALFVAGNPWLYRKTRGFDHFSFGKIEDGEFFTAVFSYDAKSAKRRFMRIMKVGGELKALLDDVSQDAMKVFARVTAPQTPSIIIIEDSSGGAEYQLAEGMKPNLNTIAFSVHPDFESLIDKSAVGKIDKVVGIGFKSQEEALTYVKANVHTSTSSWSVTADVASTSEGVTAKMAPERKPLRGFSNYNGFFARKATIEVFEAMAKRAKADGAANIMALGPSGAGKTSFPRKFAEKNGMKFYKMDVPLIGDPEEFFGKREAVDGSTIFVKSEFLTTVEEGNAVILLDEFNRAQPWILNSLYGFLDETRTSGGFKVGDSVIFVATMNVGGRFTGTFMMDAAMTNRFDVIVHFDYPRMEDEVDIMMTNVEGLERDDAMRLADIVEGLRKFEKEAEFGIDVSVRTSLRIASLFVNSPTMDVRTILSFAAAGFILDKENEKSFWDAVNPIVARNYPI